MKKEKIINIIIYIAMMLGAIIMGWWGIITIGKSQEEIYNAGFKKGLEACEFYNLIKK